MGVVLLILGYIWIPIIGLPEIQLLSLCQQIVLVQMEHFMLFIQVILLLRVSLQDTLSLLAMMLEIVLPTILFSIFLLGFQILCQKKAT